MTTFIAFIAPDITGYSSDFIATKCPGLEMLTGADMAIASFPLPVNVDTLSAHIEHRTLFVQIKIDYDALSFDTIHNFCARVQKAQIPQSQAILLRVGEFYQDDNGLFRVRKRNKEGKAIPYKPYGKTTWADYQKHVMSTMGRGVTIYPDFLPSMDNLQDWVDDQIAIQKKFKQEGKREIYPQPVKPIFNPDDIWQEMKEVEPIDPRYILVAGFNKFGPKRAEALVDYMAKELPHLVSTTKTNDSTNHYSPLYYLFKIMTDMKDGKRVHHVPGIGKKTFEEWRSIFGLPENVNLSLDGMTIDYYEKGWFGGLGAYKQLLDEGRAKNDGSLNTEIITSSFNACIEMPGGWEDF